MRDVDERDAELVLDALEEELHLLAELEVERAERLVEQQHARPAHERPGQRDPLLLPSRQLTVLRCPTPARSTSRRMSSTRPLIWFFGTRWRSEAERDVVGDGQVREERVRLEDGVDVALVRRQADDVAVAEEDPALVRLLEAADHAQRRRLAAARRAEQREEASVLHLEREGVDGDDAVELLRDAFQADVGTVTRRRAPVVDLLAELEVEEALGGRDAVEAADAARQLQQVPAVGADELDEHVELAGGDDDVARLVPAGDLLRHGLGRAGRTHADHRLGVEAEPERVRDAGDLEDGVVDEAACSARAPLLRRRRGRRRCGETAPARCAGAPR